MTIKLVVIGACGRMGKAICRLALESDVFDLCGMIDKKDSTNEDDIYESLEDLDKEIDVVIDFSFHDATVKHIEYAKKKKIPYVIGTTGFNEVQLEIIRNSSSEIPVLLSPNMSVGVNVMFLASELLTKCLGTHYNIEIIEAHHNQKADSPSGTALKLFNVVNNAAGNTYNAINGREGMIGKRDPKEIGIHAVRAGRIVGEHTLLFAGLDEEIKLVHRAYTRDTFARGALKCAEFLYNKNPGYYDMKSVLGIK